MFGWQRRSTHYVVLAIAHFAMTLPNLGAHSLWDMDEGVNAESAREMLESGNWITPYFNYEVRTSKPAMNCWIVAFSYQAFGINEFAARLPSVLFGLGSILITYEFGRRLFSPTTGFLSALILASCIEFCFISHAVTPDPPLIFFLLLALFLYWIGFETGHRWWFIPFGVLTGLAVLTKGPIGIGLPALIIAIHLLWTRRLRLLKDRGVIWSAIAFLLTAGPWYGLVTLDTKGKWVETFLLNENLNRFSRPSDGHAGGVYYHVAAVLVLFGPWVVFLPAAIWFAFRGARSLHQINRHRAEPEASAKATSGRLASPSLTLQAPLNGQPPTSKSVREDKGSATADSSDSPDKYRFLLVWFFAFLIVFSLAATKLPNYLVPAYPAIALLTGRFLDRWRQGQLVVPKWVTTEALIATAFFGFCMVAGLLIASGKVPLPIKIKGFQYLPELIGSAPIGLILIAVAIACGRLIRTGRLEAAVNTFAGGAIVSMVFIGAVPPMELQDYKVPKYLADEAGLRQTDRDIRIASCRWMRHSMVFYARREVTRIDDYQQVNQFLSVPRPAFVIIPDNEWDKLAPYLKVPVHTIRASTTSMPAAMSSSSPINMPRQVDAFPSTATVLIPTIPILNTSELPPRGVRDEISSHARLFCLSHRHPVRPGRQSVQGCQTRSRHPGRSAVSERRSH